MKQDIVELVAIEAALQVVATNETEQLADFQLAIVGGGCAEPSTY